VAAAYAHRGRCYAKKGEYDKAIADFTEAIQLNPTETDHFWQRCKCYAEKGEHDKAIADFKEVIRFGGVLSLFVEEDLCDTIIAHFTEAIRLDPKGADNYFWRGKVYSARHEHDKAIADYTEAIRLDPTEAENYRARGSCFDETSGFGKAIADYTQAIRLDSKDEIAYFNRGVLYSQMEESDKAIADYTEVIRLVGPLTTSIERTAIPITANAKRRSLLPPWQLVAEAYDHRSQLYFEMGEHDQGRADRIQSLRLRPLGLFNPSRISV
jgi:tetratricopeptide (TPR) repeat protein